MIFLKRFGSFFEKGFIGPIGDDLPSLIPIIVALVLFFTIFSITINSYNSKNESINRNISMMNVSRILKEDSMILGAEQFLDRCDRLVIDAPRNNIMVAIYSVEKMFNDSDLDSLGFDIIEEFKEIERLEDLSYSNVLSEDTDSGEKFFFCNYRRLGGRNLTNMRSNYYMRFYPVAVQRELVFEDISYLVTVPSIMVMVIWE